MNKAMKNVYLMLLSKRKFPAIDNNCRAKFCAQSYRSWADWDGFMAIHLNREADE